MNHAVFDTRSGMLHLLNQNNTDRGDVHIVGNVSGMTRYRAMASDSFLSLQDDGGTGNIDIKFV